MTVAFEQPDAGFDQPEVDQRPATPLEEDVAGVIRFADRRAPRSVQTQLGPSEMWDNCQRKTIYRLLGYPQINVGDDPWAAIIGTAVHAWLAPAFELDNRRLGRIRWIVEHRVQIRPGLSGTVDLTDLDNYDVIDHKIQGDTSMKKTRKGIWREQYRRQLMLYGMGWENDGLRPKRVILMAYPRGGHLAGIRALALDYDRRVAQEALDRMDGLVDLMLSLDMHHNPERIAVVPTTASHECTYCPYWNSRAKTPAEGCQGMLAR